MLVEFKFHLLDLIVILDNLIVFELNLAFQIFNLRVLLDNHIILFVDISLLICILELNFIN